MQPNGSLKPYTNFYKSTNGRRIFALRQSLAVARKFGDEEIVEVIERAIEINLDSREKENVWRRARQLGEYSRTRANEIDNELDRTIGALHTQLQNIRSVYHDQPRGEQAAEILATLFPEGAGPITTLSFEDELSTVQYILESLEGRWGRDLAALGIEPLVEQLDRLADQFEDALANYDRRPVGWDEVREADERGQEAMLQVVVKVLGTYPTRSDEDVEARSELLEPILEQNARIGELHRNDRTVTDVDPETGEETPPPGEGDSSGDGASNDGGQPSDGQSDGDGQSQGDGSSTDDTTDSESDQPNG